MTDPATASQKAALRMEARNRRKALLVQHPEADWMAADRAGEMLDALRLTRDGTIALYKAFGAELDPRPLGDVLKKRGWWLALPCVEEPDGPLVFRSWQPGERLAPDLSGLPAPLTSAREAAPDLILVPLLAFDRGGGRLGQGGGHYDRTLAALRGQGLAPPAVGFAYSGQEVARLPREPHDQPLDGILTEAGYIAARKDY
ncbi:MAG: 5-formyltetrahydrofolate cyclo-ligase [Caulobacter sp.]|nr:5-formyltetrahydrofolate cyclo-ligase [Caulobacter sp.]